jgi:hypothetical protein
LSAKVNFLVDPSFKRGLNDFNNQLIRLVKSWETLEPSVQDTAAEIIAELYKAFLRAGVGQELSPLTQILNEGNMPPLAGLADHVICMKSKQGTPAYVKYEGDWNNIALMQDRGYAIIPSARQRESLITIANDLYGNANWITDSAGSAWVVPGRPHLRFFAAEKLDRLLGQVAEALMTGRKLPNFKTQRPQPEKYSFNREMISIDSIQI